MKPQIDLSLVPREELEQVVIKDFEWNIISSVSEEVLEKINIIWAREKVVQILKPSSQHPRTWDVEWWWISVAWTIVSANDELNKSVAETIRATWK